MKTTSGNPILDLLFAGHAVRLVPRDPEPWLVGADVCEVLAIRNPWDAMKAIPEKWRSTLGITEGRSGRNADKNQAKRVMIIAPAGAMYLAFRSRKPEAQAFVDWLLEEVLPQIAKYGTYVAGADAAERCCLLYHRWKLERAKEIAAANAELASRGLVTIALFAEANRVELRDVLSFARLASMEASGAGEPRARVYTRAGMRRAYSEAVLRAALARLQPMLPWADTAKEAGR
jgi:prophage antirepressor-like protein